MSRAAAPTRAAATTDSILDRSLFFLDPATGDVLGTMLHTAAAVRHRELHVAQLQRRADVQGLLRRLGQLPDGHLGVRLHQPGGRSSEIAYADPAVGHADASRPPVTGRRTSTTACIYESDIRRGLITWELDHDAERRVRTPDLSNPQTQMASFEQDIDGPDDHVAPTRGGLHAELDGSPHFSCADVDSGVESCVGTVADGAALDTSTIGIQDVHGHRDRQGRQRDDDVRHLHGQQHGRREQRRAVPCRRRWRCAGHPGDVRRVHAGRRAGVHGDAPPPT